MSKLKRNAAQCVGCGKVLESTYVHDFKSHECSSGRFRTYTFFVDGGKSYTRRGWGGGKPDDHFIELSEHEPEVIEQ